MAPNKLLTMTWILQAIVPEIQKRVSGVFEKKILLRLETLGLVVFRKRFAKGPLAKVKTQASASKANLAICKCFNVVSSLSLKHGKTTITEVNQLRVIDESWNALEKCL